MASGKTHDRATWYLAGGCLVLLPVISYYAPIMAAGELIGGLYLSPDLDLDSLCFRRYGLLRWIWLPYRNVLPHRSLISHSPIIGTLGRLLYLGMALSAIVILVDVLLSTWFWDLPVIADSWAWLISHYPALERLTLQPLGRSYSAPLMAWLGRFLALYWREALVFVAGIELSCWLHLLLDFTGEPKGEKR